MLTCQNLVISNFPQLWLRRWVIKFTFFPNFQIWKLYFEDKIWKNNKGHIPVEIRVLKASFSKGRFWKVHFLSIQLVLDYSSKKIDAMSGHLFFHTFQISKKNNIGTVPMLCILNVGTVPAFRHSQKGNPFLIIESVILLTSTSFVRIFISYIKVYNFKHCTYIVLLNPRNKFSKIIWKISENWA